MAQGGKRSGAGRKPGGRNQKSREIADRAAREGITPLEVMLKAMREHYDAERWDMAAGVAKDAAPYMHPRLAAVEHTGANGGPIAAVTTTMTPQEAAEAYASTIHGNA